MQADKATVVRNNIFDDLPWCIKNVGKRCTTSNGEILELVEVHLGTAYRWDTVGYTKKHNNYAGITPSPDKQPACHRTDS